MTPVRLRLAFIAAASSPMAGCQLLALNDTEDLGVEGRWEFYVYDDPAITGDFVVLESATVTVRDPSGATLDAATELAPGTFQVEVEPGVEVDLIVSSPAHLPTVRRGRAPTTRALPTAPIFARSPSDVPLLMDSLAAVEDLGLPDSSALLAGTAGALMVEPLDPTAWVGATVEVLDATGATVPAVALTVLDTGEYTLADQSPVDLLLAPSVPTESVTLAVATASGTITTGTWTLQPGELVDGRYFALRAEN